MNIGIVILKDTKEIFYINSVAKEIIPHCLEHKDIDSSVGTIFSEMVARALKWDKEVRDSISLNDICGKDVTLEVNVIPLDLHNINKYLLIVFYVLDCKVESGCFVNNEAELFRALTRSTKIGILVHQGEKWVYVNPAVEEISGYSPEEFYNMDFWQIVHPDHVQMVKEKGFRRQKGEEVPPYPLKIIRKDGEVRWIYLSGSTTKIWGKPAGIISVIDITDKMRLEEELKKSEQRYRSILENMEEGYFETDLKGNLVFYNQALLKIGEVDEIEEIKAIHYRSFAPPKSAAKMFRVFNNVYLTGKPALIEDFDVITAKGNIKTVEISVKLLRDKEGIPSGFSGVVRDITEKVSLSKKLQESREYYQAIFELGLSATAITDKDLNIVDANKTFEELFRVNKNLLIQNRNLKDFISHNHLDVMERSLKLIDSVDNSIPPFELKAKSSLNDELDLLCNINKISSKNFYVISFMDLAPLKEMQRLNMQLEEQLRKSQRLEGIGLLASGIAHDFNNILQGMYANLLILKQDIINRKAEKAYNNLEHLINRGSKIVGELLSYAKSKEEKFNPIDLNNIVKEIVSLFRSTLPKKISFNLDLGKHIKNIHGDFAGIQQVLMNLLQNSVDAIGDQDRGEICIKTSMDYVSENHGMFPGEYVVLEVIDNGCGMDENTKSRLFEPFFTTKGPIKGTGLGMSIVKKIVDSHNGYIFIDSKVGKGTHFSIYFPAISTGEGRKESKTETQKQKNIGIKKDIRVMIVEDEEMILEMATIFLEEMGCDVIGITSGKMAIEKYEKKHKDIDVVILDINLPEVSGSEVLKKILKIDHDQKVVISSGYSKESINDMQVLQNDNVRFLQKPYSLEKLKETILELLNIG